MDSASVAVAGHNNIIGIVILHLLMVYIGDVMLQHL